MRKEIEGVRGDTHEGAAGGCQAQTDAQERIAANAAQKTRRLTRLHGGRAQVGGAKGEAPKDERAPWWERGVSLAVEPEVARVRFRVPGF